MTAMGQSGGALKEAPAAVRVALVGGGHAHVVALRALAQQYRMGVHASLSVVLVSEAARALYSGMVPGAVAGIYREEELEIDLQGLCDWAGAEFREGTVVGVDWDNGELLMESGGHEKFDVVSFNLGSFTKASDVLRSSARAVATRPLAEFIPRVREIEKELDRDQDPNSPRRVAVLGAGAAGVELAFAFKTRIEQQGRIAEVTLVNGGSGAPLAERGEATASKIAQKLAERGISVVQAKALEQEADGSLVLDNGCSLPCDFAVWATGAAAQPCARNLGLALDDEGFIRVDTTLQALGRPRVFAVGDCCAMEGHRLAKAGVYSVREGAVLADNLCRLLEGHPLEPYRPQAARPLFASSPSVTHTHTHTHH